MRPNKVSKKITEIELNLANLEGIKCNIRISPIWGKKRIISIGGN